MFNILKMNSNLILHLSYVYYVYMTDKDIRSLSLWKCEKAKSLLSGNLWFMEESMDM